jgi:hypothetical protein
MSYNGSGLFSINTTGQPVVTGTTISSTMFNALTADLATGLSTAVCKDGQQTLTANIPFGNFKITGLGAGTALTDGLNLGQAQNQAFIWAGTSGGSGNAQTLTVTPSITAYVAGQTFRFKAGFSNSGATTITISGVAGTPAIQFNGAACVGGEIIANQFYEVVFDTTSTCQLVRIGSAAGSGSITASGYTESTGTLLGRTTAGTGAIEQIQVAGNNVSLSSGILLILPPPNGLTGLNMSAPGGATTLTIGSGAASDSTNSYQINGSAFTKTTASFAAGSGNGMLDTGASGGSASTWYHVYEISKALGQTQDYMMSLSASAPTLSGGYTLYRRIGSIKLDGSKNIIGFTQNNDLFEWLTPVADISANAPGTSAVTRTLNSVPSGVQVEAVLQVMVQENAATAVYSYISDLTTVDMTPSATFSDTPLAATAAGGITNTACVKRVLTNTSAQVRSRVAGLGDANVTLTLNTLGWVDTRGK